LNLIRSLILESDWLDNFSWDYFVPDVLDVLLVRLNLTEQQFHIVFLVFVDLLILAVSRMAIFGA